MFKFNMFDVSMFYKRRIMLSVVIEVLYTVRLVNGDFSFPSYLIIFKIESIDFDEINEVLAKPKFLSLPL